MYSIASRMLQAPYRLGSRRVVLASAVVESIGAVQYAREHSRLGDIAASTFDLFATQHQSTFVSLHSPFNLQLPTCSPFPEWQNLSKSQSKSLCLGPY